MTQPTPRRPSVPWLPGASPSGLAYRTTTGEKLDKAIWSKEAHALVDSMIDLCGEKDVEGTVALATTVRFLLLQIHEATDGQPGPLFGDVLALLAKGTAYLITLDKQEEQEERAKPAPASSRCPLCGENRDSRPHSCIGV